VAVRKHSRRFVGVVQFLQPLSQAERNWKLSEASGSLSQVPRKIRQLVSDLERAGFALVPGGKSSHRKFRHPQVAGSVILSGKDGDDAHH
jgi:predicted RNA binding protein YcfA (HicA-like mRNA interferase family)